MSDHVAVTLHSHGGAFLALLGLTFKAIGHFLTDEGSIQLVTNYIAILSGVASVAFIGWQWYHQIKRNKNKQ